MWYTEKAMNFEKFKGKRICVACSGGVDSVCLLHFLKEQAKEYAFSLSAVHIEHGLRGEDSKADAAFVASLCQKEGISLQSFSVDCKSLAATQKTGVEEAARLARYAVFDGLLAKNEADYIATAHHLDDDAETVLFHLLRGSSLTGAVGLREERNGYIRPFLGYTKSDLYALAQKNGWEYRVDTTNFVADVTRNKLRLQAMPLLGTIVNGSAKNLVRFAKLAQKDDDFLYSLSANLLSGGEKGETYDGYPCVFRVSAYDKSGNPQPDPLFTRACLTAIKRMGIQKDYVSAHLSALVALKSSQTGAKITLPRGVVAKRVHDNVVFYRTDSIDTTDSAETPLADAVAERNLPFSYGITAWQTGVLTIERDFHKAQELARSSGARLLRVDADKVSDCVLRTRRTGDTFRKFGGGTKPLKKYLTDRKIAADEGKLVPLLCRGSQVLAVCGEEISDDAKTDEQTTCTAYIVFCKYNAPNT